MGGELFCSFNCKRGLLRLQMSLNIDGTPGDCRSRVVLFLSPPFLSISSRCRPSSCIFHPPSNQRPELQATSCAGCCGGSSRQRLPAAEVSLDDTEREKEKKNKERKRGASWSGLKQATMTGTKCRRKIAAQGGEAGALLLVR